MYFTYEEYYLNATMGVLKCKRPIQKVKFVILFSGKSTGF